MALACGLRLPAALRPDGERIEHARGHGTVEVEPIPGRVGQKIRNELIFSNTGGGEPLPSKYKLDITIRESVTQELVKITGDAHQEVYEVKATFKLTVAKRTRSF